MFQLNIGCQELFIKILL